VASSPIDWLHVQKEVAHFEGQLLSSQLEHFETFKIALIGWIKTALHKKATSFLDL